MMTRRSLIQSLTVSAAGLLLSDAVAASLSQNPGRNASFTQLPLVYAYNALEPVIDSMTMEIHYSKHAAAYCANLNKAVADFTIDTGLGLEQIFSKISSYPTAVRNHGGGHYNHELFWQCMKPGGHALTDPSLRESLITSFGGFEQFQKTFSDAALSCFGSGWAWLVYYEGRLIVGTTPNQDNPLMDISPVRGYPLLGLDLWEHAYYLKYQNRRAEYIRQWWNIVDWNFVAGRYQQINNSFRSSQDRF
jgi:Fe-Mn family superoxide dismutase